MLEGIIGKVLSLVLIAGSYVVYVNKASLRDLAETANSKSCIMNFALT